MSICIHLPLVIHFFFFYCRNKILVFDRILINKTSISFRRKRVFLLSKTTEKTNLVSMKKSPAKSRRFLYFIDQVNPSAPSPK
ncbi:hypothetical protein F0040_12530 [Listeria monocytogenes]|nr:hypothetical protein [Listeria monocytogenes]EAA0417454.1 hypothetical protein [Listeria monocytogenes]EAC5130649.1 hypothetical protein [Listeria monocytogenes]EAC8514378.1 hypothetical protein [Listeria monocytogenes]EAD0942821.1 hypothetical protein [Listeria monocytogenes]